MNVRTFARVTNPVSSGAIQFGDDRAGLFLKASDAKYLSLALAEVLKAAPKVADIALMHLVEVKLLIDNELLAPVGAGVDKPV